MALEACNFKEATVKTEPPKGKKLIFRRWRTCPLTGKRIYAKTVFPMLIDE